MVPAYEQFSADYPDSLFAADVEKRIEYLTPVKEQYEAIKDGTDIGAIKKFVENHRQTGYGQLALTRLMIKLNW